MSAPEDQIEVKNNLIRRVWLIMADMSHIENGAALSREDLDVWMAITRHPAIQDRLPQPEPKQP